MQWQSAIKPRSLSSFSRLSVTAISVGHFKATLAPVAGNIDQIARRFYEHMFGAHPDLLDGTFNRGNQAEGTQQAALAGSTTVSSFPWMIRVGVLIVGTSGLIWSIRSVRPW